MFQLIYQTGEKAVHQGIQTPIFDEIRGVWITDETLSLVFDMSAQSKQKLRRKRRSKIVKMYA